MSARYHTTSLYRPNIHLPKQYCDAPISGQCNVGELDDTWKDTAIHVHSTTPFLQGRSRSVVLLVMCFYLCDFDGSISIQLPEHNQELASTTLGP